MGLKAVPSSDCSGLNSIISILACIEAAAIANQLANARPEATAGQGYFSKGGSTSGSYVEVHKEELNMHIVAQKGCHVRNLQGECMAVSRSLHNGAHRQTLHNAS